MQTLNKNTPDAGVIQVSEFCNLLHAHGSDLKGSQKLAQRRVPAPRFRARSVEKWSLCEKQHYDETNETDRKHISELPEINLLFSIILLYTYTVKATAVRTFGHYSNRG